MNAFTKDKERLMMKNLFAVFFKFKSAETLVEAILIATLVSLCGQLAFAKKNVEKELSSTRQEMTEKLEIAPSELILNSTIENCVQFGVSLSAAKDFFVSSGGMTRTKKEVEIKSKESLYILGVKMKFSHENFTDGTYQCYYSGPELQTLNSRWNKSQEIPRTKIPEFSASVDCQKICNYLLHNNQSFLAKGIIEFIGVRINDDGEESPVRAKTGISIQNFQN